MTSTQEQAQEAAAQAKDKAGEVAGQAADQAKGRAREQVDQRSTQAGEQVSSTASDARQVAQALRDQGQEQPAKLAEQAADRAERLGSYLQEADADRILADIEDFGRRQPMAIVFGGLALGFAASRFLKASSEARYEASSSTGYPSGASTTQSSEPVAALPRSTPPPVVAPVTPAFPDPVVGGSDAPVGTPSGGF